MTKIKLVRVYAQDQPEGYRILVDRLWPRGKSKSVLHLDCWAKEIGPTTALRKWFNHDDNKFSEFRQKYLIELAENPAGAEFVKTVENKLQEQDVLFLYGAKDPLHNQAVILKEYVEGQIVNLHK